MDDDEDEGDKRSEPGGVGGSDMARDYGTERLVSVGGQNNDDDDTSLLRFAVHPSGDASPTGQAERTERHALRRVGEGQQLAQVRRTKCHTARRVGGQSGGPGARSHECPPDRLRRRATYKTTNRERAEVLTGLGCHLLAAPERCARWGEWLFRDAHAPLLAAYLVLVSESGVPNVFGRLGKRPDGSERHAIADYIRKHDWFAPMRAPGAPDEKKPRTTGYGYEVSLNPDEDVDEVGSGDDEENDNREWGMDGEAQYGRSAHWWDAGEIQPPADPGIRLIPNVSAHPGDPLGGLHGLVAHERDDAYVALKGLGEEATRSGRRDAGPQYDRDDPDNVEVPDPRPIPTLDELMDDLFSADRAANARDVDDDSGVAYNDDDERANAAAQRREEGRPLDYNVFLHGRGAENAAYPELTEQRKIRDERAADSAAELPLLLSTRIVADMLDISPAGVRAWARRNDVPVQETGSGNLYPIEVVLARIAARCK